MNRSHAPLVVVLVFSWTAIPADVPAEQPEAGPSLAARVVIRADLAMPGTFRIHVTTESDSGAADDHSHRIVDALGANRLEVDTTGSQIVLAASPDDSAAPETIWSGRLSVLPLFGRAEVAGLEIAWRAAEGERIYGLGERFDRFDQAGRRVEMWIKDVPGAGGERADSYFCTPVLFSSRNYALFAADNPEGEFDLNRTGDGWHRYRRAGASATFYLAVGDSLKDLLAKRAAIQGPFRGIPDWAWGPWISRNSYETQSEAEEAIRGHVARGWPVAAIVQEAWKGPGEYGDFNNFSTQRWPDLPRYFELCRQHDIRTALWQVPVINPLSPEFGPAAEAGYFVRDPAGQVSLRREWFAGFANVDFTRPEAARWWSASLKDELALGIAAIKADDGEAILPDDVFADGRRGWQVHNEYSTLYNAALHALLDSNGVPGMLWARSGSLGIERYPALWAGDQFATWDQLRCLLPAGLSASISGMPFWGHDIGGYAGTPTPELYIRWLQFGAFSPLMQYHGITPREPWFFGAAAERAYDRLVHIRMCLRPTFVALGRQAAATGLPIMRPLVMEYPDLRGLPDQEDAFLLGTDLLVTPVWEPGMAGRVVLFPPGRWQHLTDPLVFDGPGPRRVLLGLESVPVFVREGATLDVEGDVATTGWRWAPGASRQQVVYGADRPVLANLTVPLVADALGREARIRFEAAGLDGAFYARCTAPGRFDAWQDLPVDRGEGAWQFALPVPEHGEVAGLEQAFEIWTGEGGRRRRVYAGRIRWGFPCELRIRHRGSMIVESGTREIAVRFTNPTDVDVSARVEFDLPAGVRLVEPFRPDSGLLPAGASVTRRWRLHLDSTDEAASRLVGVRALAGDRLLATGRIAFSPPWRWVVAGPFPAGRRAAHRLYFGPEAEHGPDVAFATSEGLVRWQTVPPERVVADGGFNFSTLLGRHDRIAAYALTRLRAERRCPAELHVGSDDTFAIWLNGVQVASEEIYRAAAPDQDVVPIELQAGENVLVLKVAQDVGDWKAYVRLSGPGDTMLVGVHDAFDDHARYAADRPEATRVITPPAPRPWRIAGPIQRMADEAVAGAPGALLAAMRSAGSWPPALPGLTWQDWSPASGSDGTIDLTAALGPQCFATAYAATAIEVDSETPVELVCGADGGLRLWLNGEQVLDAKEPRAFVFDMYRVPATLRPGRNCLLAVINQKCGNWLFRTEILDRSKRPPRPVE